MPLTHAVVDRRITRVVIWNLRGAVDEHAREEKQDAGCTDDGDWYYGQLKTTAREPGKEMEQRQQTIVLSALQTFSSHLLKCISHKNKDLSFLALIRECKNECTPKNNQNNNNECSPQS